MKRRINIRDRPVTGGEGHTKTEKAAKQNVYNLCKRMRYFEKSDLKCIDLDVQGGTNQFETDENRNLTKHPIVRALQRKKAKGGERGRI